MDKMKAKKVKVFLGVALIGLSIFFSVDAIADFLDPLKYVKEITSEPNKFIGRNVQVVGWIVEGSWRKGNEPKQYFFELSDGIATITVDYKGDLPEFVTSTGKITLKSNVGITAIGVMTSEDTLVSYKLLSKCPSKYEQTLKEAYATQTQKNA